MRAGEEQVIPVHDGGPDSEVEAGQQNQLPGRIRALDYVNSWKQAR